MFNLPARIFEPMGDDLQKGLEKAAIRGARRHLFFCIGPDCCRSREGEMLWEFVKRRVKETGVRAMRTKAGCFRICTEGPWLVVYPDGTWYGHVTPHRFERILQEHIISGRPVREWIVAQNALGNPLERVSPEKIPETGPLESPDV